jgi:multiple sugar transport system permease protein
MQLTLRRGTRGAGTQRRTRSSRTEPVWVSYLFLAPYLALFTVFVVVPIVVGVWISLHRYDLMMPNQPWVGLGNYRDLLSTTTVTGQAFWQSMRATAIFTVASVPFLIVLPLLVAMVLKLRLPGLTIFRAIFFMPYVLGIAVIGVLAEYILDTNRGLLNYLFGMVGLPDRIAWTTSVPAAWIALVAVTVWWTMGFFIVIFLAGLQEIPRVLYEAAAVDGAGAWSRFRYVTLPGLRRVLMLVTVLTVLASANMFGQSYLITGGAPGNATRTAVMYIAHEGLNRTRMGSAAAMSYILAGCLALVSALIFKLFSWRDR